ncbi:MAG: Ribonuclease P protein component 4 [Promethearchaeota archaeon]|nr:MAG: Ribonuclease P protein component 4 [Candidatus Lokiarchaeota archaeon]
MPNYKKIAKRIAKSRIHYLFERATKTFPENRELANKYVDLARLYAQRVRIKIPKEWKRRICHKCKKFLYPSVNCRIRMQSRKGKGSHVSITCLDCGNVNRYYIKI